jgi:hypothetical protein
VVGKDGSLRLDINRLLPGSLTMLQHIRRQSATRLRLICSELAARLDYLWSSDTLVVPSLGPLSQSLAGLIAITEPPYRRCQTRRSSRNCQNRAL